MKTSMFMAVRGAVSALALGAVVFSGRPLSAQATTSDEGTFQILIDGRPVGTEEFTIRSGGERTESEVIASGTVRVELTGGPVIVTPRLRTVGAPANPTSYEVVVEGTNARKITGTVGKGRFSAKILTPSGEQLREYIASPGAIVLDEGVAHQYAQIAGRVQDGKVPVLIPRDSRQVTAVLREAGRERIEIGGAQIRARRVVVEPAGGDARHVWIDELGRVLRVEIPAQGYAAVRITAP